MWARGANTYGKCQTFGTQYWIYIESASLPPKWCSQHLGSMLCSVHSSTSNNYGEFGTFDNETWKCNILIKVYQRPTQVLSSYTTCFIRMLPSYRMSFIKTLQTNLSLNLKSCQILPNSTMFLEKFVDLAQFTDLIKCPSSWWSERSLHQPTSRD
jgi:hypothetical protein